MKKIWLPISIFITGILYIFVIPSEPVLVSILFKLIPMWLILLYAFQQKPVISSSYRLLIGLGLFFCMLGDGLLYWFVIGLTAFLIGHLFYIAGFIRRFHFSLLRAVMILPLGIYGYFMANSIVEAIVDKGDDYLVIPVIVYVAVISLMGWFALMTGNAWAFAGSLLFILSDSVLAWNKFVEPVMYSGPIIMVTYYSAQFLIARSIGQQDSLSRRVETGKLAG